MRKGTEVYKVCKCCGMSKLVTEQFEPLPHNKITGDRHLVASYYGDVCRICKKNGNPSKADRMARIAKVMQSVKAKHEQNRAKEKEKEAKIEEMLFLAEQKAKKACKM